MPELTESQEWMARDLAALGDSDLGTLVLKKEVGEVVERLFGRDLLIDHAKRGALVVADALASGPSAKRIQIAKRRLQAQDRPSSGWLPR